MLDPRLKEQLERDEGRRLLAYKDSAGYWTIGVGHLLGTSPRMSTITDSECDALLVADVEEAIRSLTAVFGPTIARLDGPRFRALVNMMFNRGIEHVQQSMSITPAIKRVLLRMETPKDETLEGSWVPDAWKAVAYAIVKSPWGAQIGARAVRLAKQFEIGVDQ